MSCFSVKLCLPKSFREQFFLEVFQSSKPPISILPNGMIFPLPSFSSKLGSFSKSLFPLTTKISKITVLDFPQRCLETGLVYSFGTLSGDFYVKNCLHFYFFSSIDFTWKRLYLYYHDNFKMVFAKLKLEVGCKWKRSTSGRRIITTAIPSNRFWLIISGYTLTFLISFK